MGVLSLRVGARSSRLSQAQTAIVTDLLKKKFGDRLELELVSVKTLGDRLPPESKPALGKAGAKGAFTGDLESLLLAGKIDIAIHSMKDLPSEETDGLVIGATPPRGDPRDALVARGGRTIQTLPRAARLGTSSLRRKAQLLKLRRDLKILELHGNVDTRLRMVLEGHGSDLDGVVLAVAGLQRLGQSSHVSQTFSIEEVVPAVGQGVIAVQMRRDDPDVGDLISHIDDEAAGLEARCERAFAKRLGVDCNVPVGGCARVSGKSLRMVGMMAQEDGSSLRQTSVAGAPSEAVSLGRKLAEALLDGAPARGADAS